MFFNKRAVVSEYSDLIFGVLIVLLLVIFLVIFNVQNSAVEKNTKYAPVDRSADVQGVVQWQAAFLANSITRIPVDGQPFSVAIQNKTDSEIQRLVGEISQIIRVPGQQIAIEVAIDRDLKCVPGTCQRFFEQAVTLPDYGIGSLRQSPRSYSATITPGKSEVYVGVLMIPANSDVNLNNPTPYNPQGGILG